MSRRRKAEKRVILQDPIYKDLVVAKFINYLMKDGKKSIAEKIFYGSLDKIKDQLKTDNPLDIFKKALEMGVAPRAEINSVDEAKEYLDMGVKHFSIGTDINILHNWWKQNGEALAKAIEES